MVFGVIFGLKNVYNGSFYPNASFFGPNHAYRGQKLKKLANGASQKICAPFAEIWT